MPALPVVLPKCARQIPGVQIAPDILIDRGHFLSFMLACPPERGASMLPVKLNWLGDAELLARVGRKRLGAMLKRLAPALAEHGIELPDPELPDARYFGKLAAVLGAPRVRLTVWIDSTAGVAAAARSAGAPVPASNLPRYALRRDGPFWHLAWQGRSAVLKHERGLCYVAELLSHPREPLKKLSLAAKYSRSRSASGGIEVYDPASGCSDMPASTAAVQQFSLADDDAEARRRCLARARELAAIVRDPGRTKQARAEAEAELRQITAFLAKDSRQNRDAAKVAGDAVRNAITRLLRRLLAGDGSASGPEAVRHEFALHLQQHLVIPTSRYAGPKARKARGELTGCLLYEPPAGVRWAISQPESGPVRKLQDL